MIEHFEGIMFLTTNRKSDFDDAFRSRIHLTINLPDLNREQRVCIWRNCINNCQYSIEKERWSERTFMILSKLDINVSCSSSFTYCA